MTAEQTPRVFAVMLLAAVALWVVDVHLSAPVVPEDDAFITYRYADHLATGSGLVYNDDERVFGSSSPLYVGWLATLDVTVPRLDLPELAVRTNVVWLLATAAALLLVLRRLTGKTTVPLLAATWFLVHPAVVSLSLKGMEAFLLTSLLLLGIAAHQRRRPVLAAFFFGLAAVTRPEGVLAVPLYLIVFRRERWDCTAQVLLALLGPGLVWTVFATLYFGSPIPHSLIAKAAPLYTPEPGAALATISKWWALWIVSARGGTVAPWFVLAASLATVLGGLGLLVIQGTAQSGARLVAGLLAAVTVLYVIANPLMFHWYGANILVFWVPALVVGLPAVLERAARARTLNARVSMDLLQGLIVGGLVLMTLWSYGSARLCDAASPLRQTGFDTRVLDYKRAADWLDRNAVASATVCAPEIGALGYYWHGKVLDACGLVSPESLPYLPCPDDQRFDGETAAVPVALVKAARPDYVVSLDHFVRQGLLMSRWFAESYEVVHRVELARPLWQSLDIVIYQRRVAARTPAP